MNKEDFKSLKSGMELVAENAKLKKRVAELEDMIIRFYNTHPQDIAEILDWWADMFKLVPIKLEGGADE